MAQLSRTKQFFYLLYGGGLTQISGFIATMLLARQLPYAEYGSFRQVLLASTFITPIFSAAIPNSLLYFLPRLNTEEERSALVQRTIIMLLGLGVLASLAMILFAGPISRQFDNPVIHWYLILASLLPAFNLGSSFVVPLLIAIGHANTSAIYSSITSLVNLVLIALAVFSLGNLDAIIISYVVSALLGLMVALYLANRCLPIFSRKSSCPVLLREQLSFAVPLGMAAVVSIWGMKLDQVIVSSFFDVQTYAIYSIGAMEIPMAALISDSIYSVIFPEVSRLMGEDRKAEVLQLWQRTVGKAMLLVMPLFGAAMIVSYPLITTVYTVKYAASVPIFQIYQLLIPLKCLSFGLLLRASGITKYDFYGSILFIILNLTISLTTIPILGVYGPPVGMVASTYLLALYLLFCIKKEIGFNISQSLNVRALLPIAAITLLPIIAIWLVRSPSQHHSITELSIMISAYLLIVVIGYMSIQKWEKFQIKFLC